MKFFYIATLGCKVNQYETQSLRESWQRQGLIEVHEPVEADVLVVNSCAITSKAVADVRATIRKLHRENPSASVVVTGCAAEVMGNDLEQIEGVAQVVRRLEKGSLLKRESLTALSQESDTAKSFPPFAISDFNRSRAVLKIQDGCSHCCTYCIVPRARGGAVSRPLGEALDEAGRLLEAGFAEIVISGINLRQFHLVGGKGHGKNLGGERSRNGFALDGGDRFGDVSGSSHGGAQHSVNYNANYSSIHSSDDTFANHSPCGTDCSDHTDDFWEFITALEERFARQWAGKARFRISSLEPGQLTAQGIDVLGKSQLIAPHLHLSLQSGSDAVLARMGRGHYCVADVTHGLERLARVWPRFGLGADIICGFPDESEDEHAQTVQLLEALPFSYAHIFPYSKRPHTLAAKMTGQIEGPIKKQRSAQLRAIASLKEQHFKESMLEVKVMHVAVEQTLTSDNKVHGVNEWYVDCVFVDTPKALLDRAPKARQRITLCKASPVGIEKGRLLIKSLGV